MNEKIDTEINRRDIIVSASKAVASFIPYVGPFMAEIIGVVIPNQRWDRISEYVRILNEKVVNLEEKINNQESVDLLEDSLLQSARALTRERKEYIASMLKNGLMKEEQTHAEKKKLLSILGELNDIEIIFLKYYSLNLGIGQKHPFKF
jgi:wyosine [tRNA(Phe)-imidazoG37] synthetase (radical SAM superfamily)